MSRTIDFVVIGFVLIVALLALLAFAGPAISDITIQLGLHPYENHMADEVNSVRNSFEPGGRCNGYQGNNYHEYRSTKTGRTIRICDNGDGTYSYQVCVDVTATCQREVTSFSTVLRYVIQSLARDGAQVVRGWNLDQWLRLAADLGVRVGKIVPVQ